MRDLVPLIGAYCGGTLAQARADMQNFLIARGASEQDARAYVQPLDLFKIFFGYSKDFFWMIPDHGAGMKHFFEFNKYANPTNTLRRIIPSEMVPDALFLRGRPLDARWSKELVVPEMLMLTIARQFEDAGLEPSDNLEKLFFEEGLRRDKRVIRLVPEPLLRQIADQDFMENALKEFPDLARHIPEDMLSQESWVSAAIESIKGRDFVALDGIPSECLLAAAQALASGVNNGAMRRLTEYLDYIRVHPEIPRRLTHQVQTEIQAALLEESMPSGNRGKGKQCVIR